MRLPALLLMLGMSTVAAADTSSCPAAAANLFAVQSWQPPPPPPPPPEKPKAPPLPFRYLGQLGEGDDITLFLGRQQITLIVHAGDVIDGTYRVDSITPQRAEFTYLPLGSQQPLVLRNRP